MQGGLVDSIAYSQSKTNVFSAIVQNFSTFDVNSFSVTKNSKKDMMFTSFYNNTVLGKLGFFASYIDKNSLWADK